ncbi:MAG: extracellular solute-binding protein [Kiritimatiellia bacterium]
MLNVHILLFLFCVFIGSALGASPAPASGDMINVSFLHGYDPDTPEGPTTREILKLVRKEPRLNPQKWGGLTLPGAGGRAPFMLSLAGGMAPDIYYCWFHIIRHDSEQGFIHPLNEWIGDDLDGDGRIDDSEAKWDGWKNVPALWRQVAVKDGKIYGVPFAGTWYYGIVYRKDLVQSAGIDPEYIPETWDEFYRWCQKLTFPRRKISGAELQRGQYAFAIENRPWAWLPWMQSAGGSPVVNLRKSPDTGQVYRFDMDETDFIVPATGEDLSRAEGEWQADFDSPASVEATAFLHRLVWAPWIRGPGGKPIDLKPENISAGFAVDSDGVRVDFKDDDIIKGVSRALPRLNSELPYLFERGEVVAVFSGAELMETITRDLNLPSDMVGIMPIPAKEKGMKPVFQVHKHFYSMTEGVGRRSKEERDMVWKCLRQITSSAVKDEEVRQKVLEGHARWCNPDDLRRMGFDEYLDEVPAGIKRNYERIDRGDILTCTEPYAGFWQAVSDLISRRLLGILLSDSGEDFDYEEALRSINADANRGLMFDVPEEVMQRKRPLARVIFGVVCCVLLICFMLILRESRAEAAQKSGTAIKVKHGISPWLMLAPALFSIALWSYYPLIRGVVMAFQSYRIVGESSWAGLDNFIMVATDSGFWASWGRTLLYVGITLVLGFLSPVLLALMLTEIPRGKVFFRTLYFLPQLTSALVITLLWKLMYDPTENGMLNQLLAYVGIPAQSWLQDPALAMICCILPGVWAGAGMASLIYVAALQSLPSDYYEAAAIDGAGIMRRFRHITLPQMLPLMVINFVGAFIAAFQGMGSIFLLTFGGPGDATNVLSLAIWKEAYNNLRFSTATTMAWFLGVALIGFTYLQIRILRRVEFRRADTN